MSVQYFALSLILALISSSNDTVSLLKVVLMIHCILTQSCPYDSVFKHFLQILMSDGKNFMDDTHFPQTNTNISNKTTLKDAEKVITAGQKETNIIQSLLCINC